MKKGKVYIMGVGPGDYKLMTLKALECIQKADVIVYDRLVGNKILKYAAKDAELIYVGKMPDNHAVPQEGINEILVKKGLEGKVVARVKGGDPYMFGRGGEEGEALFENGIEFEVIPGVTSAIAVPAYAGIPVTHRDFCSSLHIVTGHERPDKEGSSIDYEALAKVSGTLVFLMGVKNLAEICKNLIIYGKDSETPVAVVEKGTTPNQRVVTGILTDIAEKVIEAGIKSPAVTVIGKVVSLREKLEWFNKKPLSKKSVIVTRAREQASSLVSKLEDLGAEVIEFPTIKIAEPENFDAFDKVLEGLGTYKWLVFTSTNGVEAFFNRLWKKGKDIRTLVGIKICAVGEATGEELNKRGICVDYIPESFTTAALLEGLLKKVLPDEKVLLARADIGSQELSDGLKSAGIQFEDLTVYRTLTDTENKDDVLELLKNNNVDFITFTSSSTVRNFVNSVGIDKIKTAENLKVACIGPVTAKTCEELALKVDLMAAEYTIDGLVNCIVGQTT